MKNTIKKIVKVLKITFISFGILAILVVIAAINSEDTEPEKAAAKVEEVGPVAAKPEPVKEEPVVDNALMEQVFFQTLKDSYKGTAEVTFDSKTKSFNIKPTDDAFTLGVGQIINGQNLESYNSLLDAFKTGSKNLQEAMGNGYTLNLLNPVNPDNILIIAMDGEIVYKFK
jgi:hypothetical protein